MEDYISAVKWTDWKTYFSTHQYNTLSNNIKSWYMCSTSEYIFKLITEKTHCILL